MQVEIHGQRYAVRSDLDAQYIAELAGYLDEKMQSGRARTRQCRSAPHCRDRRVEHHRRVASAPGPTRAASRAACTRAREAIERLVDAVLDDARVRIGGQRVDRRTRPLCPVRGSATITCGLDSLLCA